MTNHPTSSDPRLQLVDFAHATPQNLTERTETALAAASEFLANLQTADDPATALAQIHTFDKLSREVERYFGVLSHLNSVLSGDDIRHAHHALLPKISAFYTQTGQSLPLYQLYQTVHQQFDALAPTHKTFAQKRAIDLALQGFELSGIGLDDTKKSRLADIQSKLSTLSAKFSDNVVDATNAYALPLHPDQLSGITQSGLALLQSAAQRHKQAHPEDELPTDCVATLDIPMYLAIMQYADDRTLRETLYHAYSTRASDQSDNKVFDNAQIMCDILALRQEKATLLGFNNYTEVSLATKMAENAEQVMAFLQDLAERATPFAKAEFAEMQALGKTLGIDEVRPWDATYLAEKIRSDKFNLNSDAIRPYFPLDGVLSGLFGIIHDVFGVRLQAKHTSTWHSDVQFFELYRGDELIGGIYLDLYTRTGKSQGAWLSGFQNKHHDEAGEILPVGFIVCNFTPPTNGKPSQLTFDEVVTLFHEFGHGLHHLLTQVTLNDVSGINGVEWDAVELPSQLMENFVYHGEGIRRISRHVDTGEPLPQADLDSLLSAKNFQSGLQTLRQIEFALFDLHIHQDTPSDYEALLATLQHVREEVAVIMPPKNNRFANSFSHIFAGGYASGYYSYKWAELLSCDAFSRFEETGIFNADTGKAYLESILAMGGSRPASENFYAFMGREAKIDALLKHSGFVNPV